MADDQASASAVPIIDHVGIAVNSLQSALVGWSALLGMNVSGVEEVPEEGVRVAFFGDEGRVELLEPLSDDSPIARHLERRGPGVHHVCVTVPDLAAALERARAEGIEPVPPPIRTGAGGARIAFLHPRSTGGVLLELRERADSG